MACSEPEHHKWRKVRVVVPEGVHVPMCFCGDLCKLVQSKVLGVYYGMRFFMCDNFDYDPPKLHGSMRPKVFANPAIVFYQFYLSYSKLGKSKTPPPLCDFLQWLDTEQSAADKAHVEEQASAARARWLRMMHEDEQEEKRKKDREEIRKRVEEVERQKAHEREAERERKRERARRAKAAGPEAIRKGKYPRCTQ
ncbi:unnamed protein product [Urochloa humidicola]